MTHGRLGRTQTRWPRWCAQTATAFWCSTSSALHGTRWCACLPQPGQHSVVLGADGQAVCIIRTEKVTVVPFCEVDAAHAFREGEGDKSLAFWRQAHEAFFSQELRQAGLAFGPGMKVVCEEFRVVWPLDAAVRKEATV